MVQDPLIVGATFLAYLIIVLLIGVFAYRRTLDLEDYILGGRRLGSWVTALSAQASDMSGWLLLGLPGLAYTAGLNAGWMVLGLALGTYLNWLWLAPALRRSTEHHDNALTLPDFLSRRFDDDGLLRVLSACVILVFFTIYTSSGLVAGGKLFETVFGFPYLWAVIIGGTAVVIYTYVGGFIAVSWTDSLQGSMMFVALVVVSVGGLLAAGGWPDAWQHLNRTRPDLLDPFLGRNRDTVGTIGVLSLLGWGLGYFGQPHILARFMAIRKPNRMAHARRVAMIWVVVTLVASTLVGMIGVVALNQPLEGPDTEKVFLHLTARLFHPAVAGVLLAGVLAAIMSTADSQLLVASSAVAEDLYRGLLRPKATRRELLWVGRLSVLGTALCAFGFALDPDSMVLGLVGYAWAGFGAAFGPTILLALFWDGMNRDGAAAGLLVGGLTVLVWKQLSGGVFELYELVPGFFVSTLAILIVSRLRSRRPRTGKER